MIILCDSRETDTLAYMFDHVAIDWVQVAALPFADYWCVLNDGHVVPFVFERKALGDFFGSFSGGYEKEKNKLVRCTNEGMRYKVIVEGTLRSLIVGYKHSTVEGISLVRTMFTWHIRYGVDFICCSSRDEMVTYITECFFAYGKEYKSKNKKANKI